MLHAIAWATALTLSSSVVDTWVMMLSPHTVAALSPKSSLWRHRVFASVEAIVASIIWALIITGRV